MLDEDVRRRSRRDSYAALRSDRPAAFVNPAGAAITIVLDQEVMDAAVAQNADWFADHGLDPEFGDVGVVYQDRYIMLVKDAVGFPDGRICTYIRFMAAGDRPGAAVLPVLDDGRIVLLSIFRHATRRWHWEIPRGFAAAADATARDTAMRETAEEIGVPVRNLSLLGHLHTDTGLTDKLDTLYLGHVDVEAFELRANPAQQEGIEMLEAFSRERIRDLLTTGQITDSYTLAALALYDSRIPPA